MTNPTITDALAAKDALLAHAGEFNSLSFTIIEERDRVDVIAAGWINPYGKPDGPQKRFIYVQAWADDLAAAIMRGVTKAWAALEEEER